MNDLKSWVHRNQQASRLIGVVVIVLLAVGVVAINNKPADDPAIKAQLRLERGEAKLVESALDVYYVNYGRYPVDINDAIGKNHDVRDAFHDLPDHEYKVSGDGASYLLIYKDRLGKVQTKKGNYSKDYH